MILTKNQIIDRVKKGDIYIDNFSPEKVNPNSYNLTLADELLIYDNDILCMDRPNPYHVVNIPEEGYILKPGKLYLARTAEITITNNLVPMLEGRSSIGRLGIFIHATAGFGDIGFDGFWTLEISVVQPVNIKAGVEICQIYYHAVDETTINGNIYKSRKYQRNRGIQPSLLYKEFENKKTEDIVIPEHLQKMKNVRAAMLSSSMVRSPLTVMKPHFKIDDIDRDKMFPTSNSSKDNGKDCGILVPPFQVHDMLVGSRPIPTLYPLESPESVVKAFEKVRESLKNCSQSIEDGFNHFINSSFDRKAAILERVIKRDKNNQPQDKSSVEYIKNGISGRVKFPATYTDFEGTEYYTRGISYPKLFTEGDDMSHTLVAEDIELDRIHIIIPITETLFYHDSNYCEDVQIIMSTNEAKLFSIPIGDVANVLTMKPDCPFYRGEKISGKMGDKSLPPVSKLNNPISPSKFSKVDRDKEVLKDFVDNLFTTLKLRDLAKETKNGQVYDTTIQKESESNIPDIKETFTNKSNREIVVPGVYHFFLGGEYVVVGLSSPSPSLQFNTNFSNAICPKHVHSDRTHRIVRIVDHRFIHDFNIYEEQLVVLLTPKATFITITEKEFLKEVDQKKYPESGQVYEFILVR